MCVSVASLLMDVPIKDFLAMTGEITLKGNVLPVGGVKEKVLGAARAGIKEVILPSQNIKDIDDVPEEIRKKLKFHPVDRIEEVLKLSFKKIRKSKSRPRKSKRS